MSVMRISGLFLKVLLAGASVLSLSAGNGKAQPIVCGFGGIAGITGCTSQVYDTVPSPTDKQLTLLSTSADGTTKGPTSGIGAILFTFAPPDPNFPSGLWIVEPIFDGGSAGASGTFDYSITITDPNYSFDSTIIGWSELNNTSATKQFFTDATFTIPAPGYPTVTANSLMGPPFFFSALPSGVSTLYVRDTYSADVSTLYNGFTQQQVPGPLPVLGAGAAFGFSRRLRRRIQQRQIPG